MRTLVTGISGFVGGHLAEHLLASGDAVVGLSSSGRWPEALAHLAASVGVGTSGLCSSVPDSSVPDSSVLDSSVLESSALRSSALTRRGPPGSGRPKPR